MSKRLARAILMFAIAALPLSAFLSAAASAQQASGKAGHEHKHDHDKLAKHGGEITEIGPYDVEVVHVGGKIAIYVYNVDGSDVSANADKGDAIFVVAGASKKVTLTPAAGHLEGQLDFTAPADQELGFVLRLVVSGKTHTGKATIRMN